MKDLAKAMEACEKFDEMKEEFISTLCTAMKSRGLESMDTKEVGEAVDIIKDFAEAKKCCMEALYYQKVTEAMLSYEEPRYGYNNRRYSSGRYAPKGMGSYGYWDDSMGMIMDPILMDEDWNNMGYNESGNRGGGSYNNTSSGRRRTGSDNMSTNNNSGYNYNMNGGDNQGYHRMTTQWAPSMSEDYDPRYGRSYNEFCKDRKFYTATKSEDEKRKMDKHAEEHVQDIVVSVKDIWKDADPTLKKHMKEQMTKLLSEMNV